MAFVDALFLNSFLDSLKNTKPQYRYKFRCDLSTLLLAAFIVSTMWLSFAPYQSSLGYCCYSTNSLTDKQTHTHAHIYTAYMYLWCM